MPNSPYRKSRKKADFHRKYVVFNILLQFKNGNLQFEVSPDTITDHNRRRQKIVQTKEQTKLTRAENKLKRAENRQKSG